MNIESDIQLLKKCFLKIDHKAEMLNINTLKEAHVYCKKNQLSGQVSGLLIEFFLEKKYNMTKIHTSKCSGDLHYNGINLEVKMSLGGKNNNKFNFVQLRLNHNCEYLFTAYYLNEKNINNLGELFIFKLSKDDLRKIIMEYGHYAHGIKNKHGKITIDDLNNHENNKEYALRPRYGDACWNTLLNFRIYEI